MTYSEILQRCIPYDIEPRGLPGIGPFEMVDWLDVDEAYAGQMAERSHLLKTRESDVLQIAPEAEAAAREVLDMVCDNLRAHHSGFDFGAGVVHTPDGRQVPLNHDQPLHTLAHLVQDDICILQKHGDEHVLSAALLCFPASWRLDEKFMRPLTHIHHTVDEYDAGITARVQRLFDGVKVGRPLWRFNALRYRDAALFQPRSIHDRRTEPEHGSAWYLRSERQCILRLPQSDAVVFSIHTYVVAV